jgi:hypothetical protein
MKEIKKNNPGNIKNTKIWLFEMLKISDTHVVRPIRKNERIKNYSCQE